MAVLDDIKRHFTAMGSTTVQLIIINVAIFIIVSLLGAFLGLYVPGDIKWGRIPFTDEWFAVQSNLEVFITRPWTAITYAFLHSGFIHILFNMLWLFWFGKLLEEYMGKNQIWPVFIYGSIAGAILFLMAYNVFPTLREYKDVGTMVGASAGVQAIIWAAATLLPNHKLQLILIGPVKIIYIALFYTIFDLMSVSGANAGGSWAHLGGALFGFLFIWLYNKKGFDLSLGFNKAIDWIKNIFNGRKKLKVVHRKKKQPSKRSQKRDYLSKEKPADASKDNQQKVDKILDKISSGGYESLSKQEKEFLFKMSDKK